MWSKGSAEWHRQGLELHDRVKAALREVSHPLATVLPRTMMKDPQEEWMISNYLGFPLPAGSAEGTRWLS